MDIIHAIALVIGVVTLLIGIGAVLKPEQMSKKFGISASGSTLPYVVSTGIRDVFMGLTVLILFSKQDWPVLAYVNFLLGIVAISDFTIVRKHGDRKTALVHILGAVAVFCYGAMLLYLK
jgi:Domain of unknown function (DUF4267)